MQNIVTSAFKNQFKNNNFSINIFKVGHRI